MRQRLRLAPLYVAVAAADALGRVAPALPPRRAGGWSRGVSIVVPERDAPDLLARALVSVEAALRAVDEPCQVVVVANGVAATKYDLLRRRFADVEWIFNDAPLGFSAAVAAGLARVRHAWTYLMNNDVVLEPGALAAVLAARAPDVFAVGSQIFQRSASGRREETGFVDWYAAHDGVHAFHAEPRGDDVRPHLAASGGAALFRTAPLRRYVAATRIYDPFYYEDLEWGVRAWQDGWRVVFCPASRVDHLHRATTARFYAPDALARIVERNRRLFEARHAAADRAAHVMRRICDLPYECQRALARPRVAAAVFAQRLRTRRAVQRGASHGAPLPPPTLSTGPHDHGTAVELAPVAYSYRLRRADASPARPRVLVVTPFAVFPPRHGGARRVAGLLAHLRRDHDVILVSDEASLYDARSFAHFDGLYAVHLLQRHDGHGARAPATLEARMHAHLHAPLVDAVREALGRYRPAVVQVEHVELADLVRLRGDGQRWVLGLHDAYGPADFDDARAARRFTRETLRAYDAVTVCSDEDAALVTHPRVFVVPNASGVEPAGYVPSSGASLLFMGPFRYGPNLAGIRRFVKECFPAIRAAIPQAELVVLGGDEGPRTVADDRAFGQPGVTVLAHREDVPALLAQSALTINPLEAIRGSSVKVIESVCAGRVCVSTADGARGFAGHGLPSLVVVPDVAAMQAPIVRLLGAATERHRLERPRAAELERYTWAAAARRQQLVYTDLLAAR